VSDKSPAARAQAALEIDDVLLIESECKVARDFQPTMQWKDVASFAHRMSVDNNVMFQTRTPVGSDVAPFHIVRYFFEIEVRLVKPDIEPLPPVEALEEGQIQARLRFLLAIDYRASEPFADLEALGAFSSNAQFQVWPYVREEIHAACIRLRIPQLTLPMMKPIQHSDGSIRMHVEVTDKRLEQSNASIPQQPG
jgi:hypothetical protein